MIPTLTTLAKTKSREIRGTAIPMEGQKLYKQSFTTALEVHIRRNKQLHTKHYQL